MSQILMVRYSNLRWFAYSNLRSPSLLEFTLVQIHVLSQCYVATIMSCLVCRLRPSCSRDELLWNGHPLLKGQLRQMSWKSYWPKSHPHPHHPCCLFLWNGSICPTPYPFAKSLCPVSMGRYSACPTPPHPHPHPIVCVFSFYGLQAHPPHPPSP